MSNFTTRIEKFELKQIQFHFLSQEIPNNPVLPGNIPGGNVRSAAILENNLDIYLWNCLFLECDILFFLSFLKLNDSQFICKDELFIIVKSYK